MTDETTPGTNGSPSVSERADAAVNPDDQYGLFDRVVEDADMEALLEEREKRRAKKAKATAEYKEKHEEAKGRIDGFNLAVGEVARVGRFRIKVTQPSPSDVSFTTAPGRRISISLLD